MQIWDKVPSDRSLAKIVFRFTLQRLIKFESLREGVYGMNGPFLQCLKEPDGWLFESKEGERCMIPVPANEGKWFDQIGASGLALRSWPKHRNGTRIASEVIMSQLFRVTHSFSGMRIAHVKYVCDSDGNRRMVVSGCHAGNFIAVATASRDTQVICASRDDTLWYDAVELVSPYAQKFRVRMGVPAAVSSVFRALLTSAMRQKASLDFTKEPAIFLAAAACHLSSKTKANALALLECAHRYASLSWSTNAAAFQCAT